MKQKIKKGDQVIVITGKSKGKEGKVLRVIPKHNRAIVEGINMVKRHTKPTRGQTGRIVSREQALDLSNLMVMDPEKKKGTRVGRKVEGGKKIRVAKKSGTTLK